MQTNSSQEMAAICYKELLGWYVITLKLRETVKSRLPKKSTYGSKIVPNYKLSPSKSEWVVSIEEKLAQVRQENMPGSWAKLSIYRIPHHLKHGEDKAWVPQVVSLGPYHHGDEHLRHMEQHKWRCLHRIVERSNKGIGLYLDSVKKVERRARTCYEGRISMNCNEFVEMMVLDGCFVIEMFQGFANGFEKLGYPPNDPVFSMRGSILQIQRDMIMLENQIPFFILDQLLGLQLDAQQKECMAKLVLQFFSPLTRHPSSGLHKSPPFIWRMLFPHPDCSSKKLKFDPLYEHGNVHCLGVVRRSLLHLGLKQPKTQQWSQSRERLTLCLSELREAGIQIRWRLADGWGDIQFKNGILWIPPIEIHEGTMSLFLNLIAFEQSYFNRSLYVTSYIIFMHNLINSPEDVLYLRNRRIIHHCLGSDAEVADLFRRLCQELVFDPKDSYLCNISVDLRAYGSGSTILHVDGPTSYTCYAVMRYTLAILRGILSAALARQWRALLTRKWNAWVAILKKKYVDSPWSIISLIAAFILLVLTFIQALYAVYAYYRRRS